MAGTRLVRSLRCCVTVVVVEFTYLLLLLLLCGRAFLLLRNCPRLPPPPRPPLPPMPPLLVSCTVRARCGEDPRLQYLVSGP